MSEFARLGSLVRLQRGQSYKGALVGDEGPYLLGLGTIQRNGGFRWDSLRRYGGETPDRILLRPGDLYVSLKDVTHKADLLGAVARVPSSVALGRLTQDTIRLDVSVGSVDEGYLYWALQDPSYRRYCRSRGTGTTNLDLSQADFLGYEIRTPALSVQRAIAEVLGALDDKIAANDGLVALAAQLSLALVASHQPSVPLSEVVAVRKRTLTPEIFGPSPVAHFSLPAYDDGKSPVMTDPVEIKSAKVAIDSPAVLVSKLNPRFPRIWDLPIVPPDGPALASTEFLVLDSAHASSSLLWAILSQPSFSKELQGKAAGTSGSHQRVRPDALLATDVIDPRLVSERAQATVTSLGRTIHFRRQESRSLVVLRDTLLPQLMSGKVRVKDAERAVGEVV